MVVCEYGLILVAVNRPESAIFDVAEGELRCFPPVVRTLSNVRTFPDDRTFSR